MLDRTLIEPQSQCNTNRNTSADAFSSKLSDDINQYTKSAGRCKYANNGKEEMLVNRRNTSECSAG